MNPYKAIFVVCAFFSASVTHAQQAVSASGGNAIGSGGSSSYTVGQVAFSTNIGSNGSVAQGVQIPYEFSTIVGLEATGINLELKAYPNPANNVIHLSISDYKNGGISYRIYNIQGKLLIDNPVKENLTSILLRDFSGGVYLLNVLDNNELIKTFRIIKPNNL
tara:strand:+ start:1122 stop:1610 length:489 start_codon:yes stop_codon:yes gene_type:complete